MMDDECTDHYEKQLYTVFKTFDLNNEEALDKCSVVQLCDALQLEDRGAALTDELFAEQPERVTFAQFRAALLAALARPEPVLSSEHAPDPVSDDAGDDLAPRLLLGCKRYGRRSRPPRAASAPRELATPRSPRTPRSASVMARADIDPERRLDADAALELCRRLHVRGVDRALVSRVLHEAARPPDIPTVAEFFERLNLALSDTIDHAESELPIAPHVAPPDTDDSERLPVAIVLEAWERAGVHRPRRLLAELGFSSDIVAGAELERALDEEKADPSSAAAGTMAAALALARLRLDRALAAAARIRAERDKLRGDVAAGERRARLLAADVDEQHARLEAELRAQARRHEERRAEDARAAAAATAAERERAQSAEAALAAAAERHACLEERLQRELALLRARVTEAESAVAGAEERAAKAEAALMAARQSSPPAHRGEEEAVARMTAAEAALAALTAQHAALRDRCDELVAALERRGVGSRAGGGDEGAAASFWDEAAAALRQLQEQDISGSSMESVLLSASTGTEAPAMVADVAAAKVASVEAAGPPDVAAGAPPDATPPSLTAPAATGSLAKELEALERRLLESLEREEQLSELVDQERQQHDQEVASLNDTIERLESEAEALRSEAERVERYWAEAAAGQRGARLPAVPELPQLEDQVAQLQQELDVARSSAGAAEERARTAQAAAAAAARALVGERAAAARATHDLQRAQRELRDARQACAAHQCRMAADASGRRMCASSSDASMSARLVRAGAAAARLAHRLAAADRLVAELFAENCRLHAARALPDL